MLAVSHYQLNQWGIFLLLRAKADAENSTALANNKFTSIFRQSKQKIQFMEICLENLNF